MSAINVNVLVVTELVREVVMSDFMRDRESLTDERVLLSHADPRVLAIRDEETRDVIGKISLDQVEAEDASDLLQVDRDRIFFSALDKEAFGSSTNRMEVHFVRPPVR